MLIEPLYLQMQIKNMILMAQNWVNSQFKVKLILTGLVEVEDLSI